MEIGDMDMGPVEADIRQRRQYIAEALAGDTDNNPYGFPGEDVSEMARLRLAKEYVKLTEELQDMTNNEGDL